MTLNVVFMGTPDFAVPVLDAILAAGHHVEAVYSQPPRPAGRGMAPQISAVHRLAEAHGLRVLTPVNFKSAPDVETFAAHKADAAVVVAYGLILPQSVLSAPRFGCFNVHASKLPRWRGAAPIQRAIMAGDTATAVMVMRMEHGLDTGPVCLSREIAISETMTAGDLHEVLSKAGAEVMVEALVQLEAGKLIATPQDQEGVTYAAKIGKDEAHIDFALPAAQVINRIRGLSPHPGAWFALEHADTVERVKALRAESATGSGPPGTVLDDRLTIACGSGAVRLIEVQRAGKKPAKAGDFLRGFKIAPGARLT
jgi:methionyl-tRNA formyltransferase